MTGRPALPDVVDLAQALIRLDTSNPPGGERAAIELLADVLGRAGLECTVVYGFTPLRLPRGFPLRELIHGVDERVPVESLRFGVEVLGRLLARMAEPSGPHAAAAGAAGA